MASKVELIKDIKTSRDNERDEIDIAMDGRYKSTTIPSRMKTARVRHKTKDLPVKQ